MSDFSKIKFTMNAVFRIILQVNKVKKLGPFRLKQLINRHLSKADVWDLANWNCEVKYFQNKWRMYIYGYVYLHAAKKCNI